MDLPYPSQKDEQFNARLGSSHRKHSLVLKDSLRNIPPLPPLPASLKKQVLSLIKDDFAYELRELIQKEVISMRVEVGRDGSQQNMLHLCCRENAAKCLTYLLKTYYLYFPAQYEWWINLGSNQRMTGAMLCALCGSNDCLRLLLQCGGVDIHLIDSNKQSAYQIALNSKNQPAIKMLMQYEGSKRTQILNKELLCQQVELKPGKISFCQAIYRCLLECLTGSSKEDQCKKARSNRRAGSVLQVVSGGIEGYFMDKVQLGYSKEKINSEEVKWRQLGEYQEKGSTGVLFDTFSPFDMEDITHPIENFLIILQSLSQHPWLVRRAIQSDRSKSSNFIVTMYPKHVPKSINIDSSLPFIAQTNQPLFIADKKQGWPMLIQKALAKHYGSYSNLQKLSAKELMQNLTGWPVIKKEITDGAEAMKIMQKMTAAGYMFLLEGKQNSLLSCPTRLNCCFTTLTFYSKGDKRTVLINCPFVDPAWIEKERHEILALKILRGHYNCRQQMTIWVEEQRIQEYFSSLLIAPVKTGHYRYSLQIPANVWLYFRVEVLSDQEEPVILYLIDMESHQLVSMQKIEGWYAQKKPALILPPELFREEMISFDAKPGEHLFRMKVPKGKYQIVGWAAEQIKLQPIEESFGQVEWIECLKKHLSLNWNEQDSFVIRNTGDYTLMMVKSENNCWASGFGSLQVIEGNKGEGGAVEMLPSDGFQYCVVRGQVQSATFCQS